MAVLYWWVVSSTPKFCGDVYPMARNCPRVDNEEVTVSLSLSCPVSHIAFSWIAEAMWWMESFVEIVAAER
jgi:hypothetical protein